MSQNGLNTEINPDVPGRGAWRTTGGLLRLSPTSTKNRGYYRKNVSPEAMIGLRGSDPNTATYSERAVYYAVVAWQRMLHMDDADGLFGPATHQALFDYQDARTDEVGAADGVLGPTSALSILKPLIRRIASQYNVPAKVLGGVSKWESGLDPAAVGSNGVDSGLCQINLGAHKNVTLAQACDPAFALDWTAQDLIRVYTKWKGNTKADAWKVAIANHNSPALAKQWATSGTPPFSQQREDNGFPQIEEYVANVLSAGGVFE